MKGRVKNGDAIFIYIKVNFPLCVQAKYTLKQDRKEGKMGWKEISDLIKEVFRQIKINFPVTLKLPDTINIFGRETHSHFPEGTDLKAIEDTLHKPESENLTVQNTLEDLQEQHPQLPNLPEFDRLQLITTSTIASIIEGPIISEKVAVSEAVRVKLSPVKSINDENET